MGLYEDVKAIFVELLGEDGARILESFDNPKLYPKDFLEEVKHFLSNLLGEKEANKKLELIYKKYKNLISKNKKKEIYPGKNKKINPFINSGFGLLHLDWQGKEKFAPFSSFTLNPNIST